MEGPGSSVRPSACPRCRAGLTTDTEDLLRCLDDDATYRRERGIWRFLDRSQTGPSSDDAFTDHYRTVRQAEGWGSDTADYYRRLPFEDRSGRHPEIWRVRAVTYRHLVKSILARVERRSEAVRTLDLGAGNGWLGFRLTERGHQVAAVDLDDDPRDGLGAIMHYGDQAPAECVQASFDALPWRDRVFHLAIYNGSLHYSADYARTLREALRVLVRGGQVVVLDTPFYQRQESGATMVRERTQRFLEQHGLAPETTATESFLTDARLAELGRALGITWRVWHPFYGVRWALRPLQNRLLGRREPVRFRVVAGTVTG